MVVAKINKSYITVKCNSFSSYNAIINVCFARLSSSSLFADALEIIFTVYASGIMFTRVRITLVNINVTILS